MPERYSSLPPAELADRVQWLIDRAQISDLLFDFGRRVDSHDQAGYAANFAEDAVLDMPFGLFEGREKIAAMRGPAPPMGTHHMSTNHLIELDGDTARSRSYLQATHIADVADPAQFWQAGGWYDCEYQRTPTGWEFTRVQLTVKWAGGDPRGSAPISRNDPPKES